MKEYSFKEKDFSNPGHAIEISMRMGWKPRVFQGTITITYPETDHELVEFIFSYFM